MRTVADFRVHLERKLGEKSIRNFGSHSKEHREFLDKLFKLGWNRKTEEPLESNDIDATAELTDQEWTEFDEELDRLIAQLP